MNVKRKITLIVSIGLFAAAITLSAFSSKPNRVSSEPKAREVFKTQEKKSGSVTAPDNMKGVWITYMDLTMEYESDKSETAFRKKFESIAADCKSFGFNTLIVQVRPFCDSLYRSKYFPYSHILTGTQGKDPGYDPLSLICEICEKRNLMLHAWINPYRISVNNVP